MLGKWKGTILEQFGHRFVDFGRMQFWHLIKDLHTYVWKKNLHSLQIMINCRSSLEISIMTAEEHLECLISNASPMDPIRVLHLGPIKGLTVSRSPGLHWKLAFTRRVSPPKIIFWNSPRWNLNKKYLESQLQHFLTFFL